ncbi:MAG: methyl-accepting chemotaxis protein [Pseudomonadota bacterium]
MSIARLSKLGAYGLIALLVVALAIATFGVNQIRFGGPIHDQNRTLSEFNADINPPPIYLVEAFAIANVMAIHPESYQINEIRLGALEREMQTRAALWAKSDMPEPLKKEVADAVTTDAAEFWNVVNAKLKPAIRSGNAQRIDKSLNHLLTSYRRHRAKIDGLVKTTATAQQDLADGSATTVGFTTLLLVVLALSLAGAVVAATWLMSKHVLVPLSNTADTMQRMAAGDLAIGRGKSDRKDEIGTMHDAMQVFRRSLEADREREAKQVHVVDTLSSALDKLAVGDLTARIEERFDDTNEKVRETFNTSVQRLAHSMGEVRASAQSVKSGSTEIRSASDDLSLRNTQQAASLEETAAALSEVTQLVKKSANNARVAKSSIAQTHQQASNGGDVVKKAVGAMAAIEDSSSQITQIIDVIDGIAFQTNLLALNAGVEAARAGEAGKGFAVVANEVRALAQRSADAARDIKQLIGTSTGHVNEGVSLVGETGQVLSAIVDQIGTVTAQVEEIAEMAVTQSDNLDQVNSSVGTMDTMTQQNAAMVEQTNAASRSLSDEATLLAQLVARFKVAQGDTSAPQKSTPAPATATFAPRAHSKSRPASKPIQPAPSQGEILTMGNLAVKSPPPAAAPPAPPLVDDDQDWSEF